MSQQMSLKWETNSHVSTWAQVLKGKDKAPLLIEVEEVVQAKLVEERNRRARELNLKVKGLPTPPSPTDQLDLGKRFLCNTLDIPDITLDKAWLGQDSTLFLRLCDSSDRLQVLRANRKLFSLPNKVFLDEDLTRAQVVELKQAREQVAAARQAGKWAMIRNLRAVVRDTFPPGWAPRSGNSK